MRGPSLGLLSRPKILPTPPETPLTLVGSGSSNTLNSPVVLTIDDPGWENASTIIVVAVWGASVSGGLVRFPDSCTINGVEAVDDEYSERASLGVRVFRAPISADSNDYPVEVVWSGTGSKYHCIAVYSTPEILEPISSFSTRFSTSTPGEVIIPVSEGYLTVAAAHQGGIEVPLTGVDIDYRPWNWSAIGHTLNSGPEIVGISESSNPGVIAAVSYKKLQP